MTKVESRLMFMVQWHGEGRATECRAVAVARMGTRLTMRSKRYLLLIARKKRRRVSSQVIVARIRNQSQDCTQTTRDAGSIGWKCLGDGLFLSQQE